MLIGLSLGLLGCAFLWPTKNTTAFNFSKNLSLKPNQAKLIRYKSYDKQNRPFVIESENGQHISKDHVLLHQLKITLSLDNGAEIKMKGTEGVYNPLSKQMKLMGLVCVDHSNGTHLKTCSANINFEKGTAENNELVEGYNHQSRIKSQGFKVLEKGQHIIFLGSPEVVTHH